MKAFAGIAGPGVRDWIDRFGRTLSGKCPVDAICQQTRAGFGLAWHRSSGMDGMPRRDVSCIETPEYVVAFDGRIDDRTRTLEWLRRDRTADLPRTDAEIVLEAYRVWGGGAPSRLLGDFAFAIWDTAHARLFCARDRLGVRQMHYRTDDAGLLFATDLTLLRAHPGPPDELDEDAMADFLLFGYHRDAGGTAFRNLRQIPPAHTLSSDADGLRLERYWKPSPAAVPRYRHPRDYVEHLQELLCNAVADRSRESRVGILLSGGMDSTSVAACAVQAAQREHRAIEVHGYTMTATRLCPADEEGRYASIAGLFLGVPGTLHAMDAVAPFERWEQACPAERVPDYNAFAASHLDLLQRIRDDGIDVVLSGEGGDPSFLCNPRYWRGLLWHGHWGPLACELWGAFRSRRSLRGLGLRALFPDFARHDRVSPAFPEWIRSEFSQRLGLEERWRDYHAPPGESFRREQVALDDLADAAWIAYRFRQDEGVQSGIEVRYPFWDPRVLEFLLGVPQYLVPDKWILRAAMRDWLPESITQRPKAPFPCNLLRSSLVERGWTEWRTCDLSAIEPYVDVAVYRQMLGRIVNGNEPTSPWDWIHRVAPIGLAKWLRHALPRPLL